MYMYATSINASEISFFYKVVGENEAREGERENLAFPSSSSIRITNLTLSRDNVADQFKKSPFD